jgi:large subunit ribosomal protein L32e
MADEEEDVQIVETGAVPKPKPELGEGARRLMATRKKKPRFVRQQTSQFRRLGETWRRPRGRTSKQRIHRRYRPPVVRIGYGSPKPVRGLHPSGFSERLVHTVGGVENIDPKTEAIRIGRTVGRKKRLAIIEKADERGIRVLNRGV